LTVNGNVAGATTVNVDDVGSTVSQLGTVTTTGLTGLGMAQGIRFINVETLRITTGSGNDTVKNLVPATSTPAVFNNLGAGQDGLIFYGTEGNDTIRVSWQATADGPQVTVQVNGQTFVSGYASGETIIVYAGAGDDTVIMDDTAGLEWRA